jgi:hypothetical protein
MRTRPWRRPNRRVALLLLAAARAAAAAADRLLFQDTAKPASVAAAVAQFRRGGASGRGAGVYVYATKGGESVHAFVSAHHVYPARTSLIVARVKCGIRLHWAALEGRSTTWTVCRTSLGFELRVSDEVHRFFGQTDRTVYTCAGAVLGATSGAGGDRPFRCRSAHGYENGRVHVFGRARLLIGGRQVAALHVRTAGRVGGGDTGSEVVDWWLQPDSGLPLRLDLISRTSRPLTIGRARYREDAVLRLVATSPLR